MQTNEHASSQASPTPGPWEVVGHYVRTARTPEDGSGLMIADVGFGFHADPREHHANARLIAATPDLLNACVALVRGNDLQVAIDLARAAIAKGEGR